jgi:hypothetical protein
MPDALDEQFERHRAHVVQLSKPGGVLTTDSRHATTNNPLWFDQDGPTMQRRAAHRQIRDQWRAATPQVGHDRVAILLAGPPGAGKGRTRDTIIEEMGSDPTQWRIIDADDFKDHLLEQAIKDGDYDRFLKPQEVKDLEAQGERFFPRDLASLVHEESSMLAMTARTEAIEAGENIVIDSVLGSKRSADELAQQLQANGYKVIVVDVEVPFEVSQASIKSRWKQGYLRGLEGSDPLGGRTVPSDYDRDIYNGPGGKSKPEATARHLANTCPAVSEYQLWRGAPAPDGGRAPLAREQHLRRARPGADLQPAQAPTRQPAAARPAHRDPNRHTGRGR